MGQRQQVTQFYFYINLPGNIRHFFEKGKRITFYGTSCRGVATEIVGLAGPLHPLKIVFLNWKGWLDLVVCWRSTLHSNVKDTLDQNK